MLNNDFGNWYFSYLQKKLSASLFVLCFVFDFFPSFSVPKYDSKYKNFLFLILAKGLVNFAQLSLL